jgi:hypothetical protein
MQREEGPNNHDETIRRIVVDECGTFISLLLLLSIDMLTGAKLVYLPPYSTDFNPIEQSFHSLKAWLRRHEAEAVNPACWPWLIHQAAASLTPGMAEGWILNCGYSFLND